MFPEHPMRICPCLAVGLIPLAGWGLAQVPPAPPAAPPVAGHETHMAHPAAAIVNTPGAAAGQAATGDDPYLRALLDEALARNPDLAQVDRLVAADRERIPQAAALPDPMLSLGIQNDGFDRIQVGQMETSYYQIMVTQPLPYHGKRALRGEIAGLSAKDTELSRARTLLTVEAEVRRGYTSLLLVRSQLKLLADQAVLLKQAEATARNRYEVGQGAQADLLRAQLERTRLEQTRFRLLAEERTALGELNRVRGLVPDAPVATLNTLEQVPDPAPIPASAMDQAEDQSPELRSARLGVQRAERSLSLARLDRRPDFSVSAGYMPRGGLDPMWTASIGITLPIWQKNKQMRAVAEQEQRSKASGWEAEKVRCLLAQRIQERSSQMDSDLGVIGLYRGGLLVQSESSFRATLAQYGVGKAPFLSVLEALNGWVADQSGLLQAQADAQAVRIAQLEWNLGATPGIGGTGLQAGAMGGSGGGQASSGMGGSGGAKPAAGGGSESNSSNAM
jgi:outer membrane protein TolC